MKDLTKNSRKSFHRRLVKRGNSRTPVIGSTEYVSVARRYHGVPAKIDTGADSTSIWASNIKITPDNALEFTLFGAGSPHYDGHVFHFEKGNYEVSALRNSTGDDHYRYRVYLSVKIGGKKIRASLTLADRSKNGMPILIGRSTISGKFFVDVSFNPTGRRRRYVKKSRELTRRMLEDPHSFHQTYHPSNSNNEE